MMIPYFSKFCKYFCYEMPIFWVFEWGDLFFQINWEKITFFI
ncbi:hypothetical protein JJD26997_0955 [Campylobacter jejuni subsp. doylei 269.97]|uniref:Uncharacterized protein n=1 Tax=Campylobacter jejuni subsp. doylei (strain ATCC BAA-1458 / RM4099 / 269.97) TaxID=360109 RepID=A7H3I8_CAMJD|nr:hypothetical protein JJD26997_0955 [Campylobacter jejuni subsp. doylei 269.97]